MARIADSVKRYLAIKTVVALITGVSITIWLMIQGVDFAPVWGFLAFLLNFVPKIGSLVAAIPAILMALVQLGMWHAVMVVILSIPLTMIFKITMESNEDTRWLGIMLDDAPKKPKN